MRRWLVALALGLACGLIVLHVAGPAHAEPSAAARLAEAKEHFLRGVDHSDRGEWDAALAEFLKSREILPTAKNTYNAAVCLRRVSRFDEALDMYERLLRDFRDLPLEERRVAQRELAQLKASVGAIELRGGGAGAAVAVDGRDRGTLPLDAPVRVGAGTHTIRVSRDGFLPFDTRVDVVGMQTAVVNIELVALTSGGRLHVAEQTGKTLEVVVDDAVVGKTPWDGVLPPGDHSVLLRGAGGVGTQPMLATVKLKQTLTLDVLAEQLEASLRVHATPPTANVSIDRIPVGRGAWEGRLRAGTHAVEVTADGYLPFKREVDLKKDGTEALDAALVRDPALAGPSASLGVELDVSGALGILWGGDLASSCADACSASLPLGGRAALHAVYQVGSGFGGGLDIGYLVAFRSFSGRAETLDPVGAPPPNPGPVDDALRLSGLTLGASGQYRKASEWPVLFRLGAGVLLGSVRDERSGSFRNTKYNEAYDVSAERSGAATYLYAAPELRVGRRFGEHLELNVGVEVLLMAAIAQPTWRDGSGIRTSNRPPSSDPASQGDGSATFGDDSLLGSFVVVALPGLGARYDF